MSKTSVGVSKGVFVGELIATLILSAILSYGVLVAVGPQKGDKGDPGPNLRIIEISTTFVSKVEKAPVAL